MKYSVVLTLSLLTFVLAGKAIAQDILFNNKFDPDSSLSIELKKQARGEIVPDTTNWRDYLPIQIGNEWQYRKTCNQPGCQWSELFFGYKIVSDTTINGEHYWGLQTCQESIAGEYACSSNEYIKYDEINRMILRAYQVNSIWSEEWWGFVPCAMDADFNSVVTCTGPGAESLTPYVYGEPYTTIHIPPSTIEGVAHKTYEYNSYIIEVVRGIGTIYHSFSEFNPTLIFARINNIEYGDPRFVFPVGTDEHNTRTSAFNTFPNPTHGLITVKPTSNVSYSIVIYDIMGRSVYGDNELSYEGEVVIDLSNVDISSGNYFMVIIHEDGVRSAKMISLVK